MRPLTREPTALERRIKASLTATLLVCALSGPAFADCPWIVQPSEAIGGDRPDYEIAFTGDADPTLTYYGFTVTDHDLAWQLSSGRGIAALDGRARPLQTIDSDDRLRYRAAGDSVLPLTLYLVVASAPVERLESITAGFEPARPIAIGLRTRGASDSSGPLPHRSLPGIEIAYAGLEAEGTELGDDADYQLCAYQVLIR